LLKAQPAREQMAREQTFLDGAFAKVSAWASSARSRSSQRQRSKKPSKKGLAVVATVEPDQLEDDETLAGYRVHTLGFDDDLVDVDELVVDTVEEEDVHVVVDTVEEEDVHVVVDTVEEEDVHVVVDTVEEEDVRVVVDTDTDNYTDAQVAMVAAKGEGAGKRLDVEMPSEMCQASIVSVAIAGSASSEEQVKVKSEEQEQVKSEEQVKVKVTTPVENKHTYGMD